MKYYTCEHRCPDGLVEMSRGYHARDPGLNPYVTINDLTST